MSLPPSQHAPALTCPNCRKPLRYVGDAADEHRPDRCPCPPAVTLSLYACECDGIFVGCLDGNVLPFTRR